MMKTVLSIDGLSKEFRLHQQGNTRIPVLSNVKLEVKSGEAVAVTGSSGRGKSSLLKLIFGTYRASSGVINVLHKGDWVDVASAQPREVIELRQETVGYVTQFLRVIPRVPTIEIVSEPLMERGADKDSARERAATLLKKLNIAENMWKLSPMTFSGGEQQRVNIARGFAAHHALLLLDEPTASLDSENRDRVISLVAEAKSAGSAIVAVFHNQDERNRVCDREFVL